MRSSAGRPALQSCKYDSWLLHSLQVSTHCRAVSAASACKIVSRADLDKAVGDLWRDVHRFLKTLVGCLGVAQSQVLSCPRLRLIAPPAKARLLTLLQWVPCRHEAKWNSSYY